MSKSCEWVELLDPKSQHLIYVNLSSGVCSWDPPPNQPIKPRSSDQWWELFDVKAQQNYYYNCSTRETVWQKPESGDIIPLAGLQLLHQSHHQPEFAEPSEAAPTRPDQPPSLPTTLASSRPAPHGTPRTFEHQRVRDWLHDANVSAIGDEMRNTCLSDRPHRRGHQLSGSVAAAETGHSTKTSNAVNTERPNGIHRPSHHPPGPTSLHHNASFTSGNAISPPLPPPPLEQRRSKSLLTKVPFDDSTPPNLSANRTWLPHPTKLSLDPTATHLPYDRTLPAVSLHVPFQARPVFPRTNPTISRPASGPKAPRFTQSATLDRQSLQSQQRQFIHTDTANFIASVKGSYVPISPGPTNLKHPISPETMLSYPDQTSLTTSGGSVMALPVFHDPFSDSSNLSSSSSSLYSSDADADNGGSSRLDNLTLDAQGWSSPSYCSNFPYDGLLTASDQFNRPVIAPYPPVDEQPPLPPPRSASTRPSQQYVQSTLHNMPVAHGLYRLLEPTSEAFDHPHQTTPIQYAFYPAQGQRLQQPAQTQVTGPDEETSDSKGNLTIDSTEFSFNALVTTDYRSTSTGTTWASSSTMNGEAKPDEQDTTREAASLGSDLSKPRTQLRIPQRSPSGGFIGPADPRLSGVYTTMRLPEQLKNNFYTLIYPGHPDFERLTAPFDWPKELFKPDQDVKQLMSWTKKRFGKRILANTDATVKKQVLDMFRIVQSFMGDHKARLSLPDYGSVIIHRALNSIAIRDELLAQICKQTTNNPNLKSLQNGWVLLCVCLYYFAPSESRFRAALSDYLSERAQLSVDTSMIKPEQFIKKGVQSSLKTAAAIASGFKDTLNVMPSNHDAIKDKEPTQPNQTCTTPPLIYPVDLTLGTCDRPTVAHFAHVAPRWLARSLNIGLRKFPDPPSLHEIRHVKDFILKPNLFGSSLEEIMRIQCSRFPRLKLPWIQLFLTEEVLRMNGAQLQGIFRLSPDADTLTEIRCYLEKLFEVFRVVCDVDSNSSKTDPNARTKPTESFYLVSPPPPGWLPTIDQSKLSTTTSTKANLEASFPEAADLTGDYSWPIIPAPLSCPPPEFSLMTRSSQWPRSLCAIAKLCPIDLSDKSVDAHLAAGLLKMWLRELSPPLISPRLQPDCLKAALDAETINKDEELSELATTRITDCCRLVRRLHPVARRSLIYLILLLQHLSKPEYTSTSLMSPHNFALVLAPSLMRSDSTDPQKLMDDVRLQAIFLRILICHLNVPEEIDALSAEEDR